MSKNKVKKLIYTSSPSVIFGKNDLEGVDEKTPYPDNYLCHYAKTKAIAEKMVIDAKKIEIANDTYNGVTQELEQEIGNNEVQGTETDSDFE